MANNPIVYKSKKFALRIIKLYKYLAAEKENIFYQSKFFAAVQVLAQMSKKPYAGKVKPIFMPK